MSEHFRRIARVIGNFTGSVTAFTLALLVILTWAVTGPIFAFSDTWQLVINTGTTIVTFLMVFLIQNTQNRETQAIHTKLNELLYSQSRADNHIMEAENLSEEEMTKLQEHYLSLAGTLSQGRPSPRRTESDEEAVEEIESEDPTKAGEAAPENKSDRQPSKVQR